MLVSFSSVESSIVQPVDRTTECREFSLYAVRSGGSVSSAV